MKQLPRLNTPRLNLPAYQLVTIFRAWEWVLTSDTLFPGACNTFLSWRGTAQDASPPVVDLCPFCRITPVGVQTGWVTESQHSIPLAVEVELAVAGTDYDQLGNFWGVLENALFPQNQLERRAAVQGRLTAVGVTRPSIMMTSMMPQGDSQDAMILLGKGQIVFGSLVST